MSSRFPALSIVVPSNLSYRNCILPPSLLNHPYALNQQPVAVCSHSSLSCAVTGVSADFLPVAIFDVRGESLLQGHQIAAISDDPSQPDHQVFLNIQKVSDFFKCVFGHPLAGRDADNGILRAVINYGQDFQNVMWNGRQLVYGTAGGIFNALTPHVELTGHELMHGFLEEALISAGEPGAVKEHLCDVMGILAKFYDQKTPSLLADWTIAPGLMADGSAVRTFIDPGKAFDLSNMIPDLPSLGDGQVAFYRDRITDPEELDDGGVHSNSGILSHGFYLFATNIGGEPWGKAGHVWFDAIKALKAGMNPSITIADFARLTVQIAENPNRNYALNGQEVNILNEVWKHIFS